MNHFLHVNVFPCTGIMAIKYLKLNGPKCRFLLCSNKYDKSNNTGKFTNLTKNYICIQSI